MPYQYIYIISIIIYLILAVFYINNIKINLFFFKKENKIIKSLLFSFNNYSDFNFIF